MNSKPLVSVIIPTYNYARYICEAIDSVLASNFPSQEIEIVIVDDGSTDHTAQVIEPYKDRVKYIYQENHGKAEATGVAIENSCGQYIFNLDADDLFLPNKIQEVVNVFQSDSEIVHVAHPALFWNVDNETKVIEKIPKKFLGTKTFGKTLISHFYQTHTQFGGGSTFAVRREAATRFSIPKEVDMYIDEYILLAALTQGCSFFIEHPLSVWRVHNNNFSQDQSKATSKLQRSLASKQAVLKELETLGVEEHIQRLYQLKILAFSLFVKEQLGEKKPSDLINLALFFSKSIPCFGLNTVRVFQSYKILNRALPTRAILWLKALRGNS
jgi:glycosyltransferase involved in cell wall biosynthesis